MSPITEYRLTGLTILLHTLVLNLGFFALMGIFEFPDILRMPAEYRMALFQANRSMVIPIYYILALTGFSQIIVSILLFQVMEHNRGTVVLLAVVFGVLTGVFQLLGFIRWSILIPFIAETLANDNLSPASKETALLIEATFNRYGGMAVGEHLGFMAQGLWTLFIGLAILGRKLFDRRLGWIGLLVGALTLPMSMEPLGGPFVQLGGLTSPVMTAWSVWLILRAVSLLKADPRAHKRQRFGKEDLKVSGII